MSTSRSSALIDSSCTGYRPCTRRRPSLAATRPPAHSSVTHGAAVREVAPPTVAGAAFPARGGQPLTACHAPRQPQVHPRARGAALAGSTSMGPPSGSSPRVRGSRSRPSQGLSARGSMPARVGQPPSGPAGPGASSVYPRYAVIGRRRNVAARCAALHPAPTRTGGSPRRSGCDRGRAPWPDARVARTG